MPCHSHDVSSHILRVFPRGSAAISVMTFCRPCFYEILTKLTIITKIKRAIFVTMYRSEHESNCDQDFTS